MALSLRKADRVMSQIYNDYLSPLGLKVTQFSMLRALNYLGSTTAKSMQHILVMEQATVSRALKPLLRDGYIIVREGEDRREKVLSLSKSGQSLYEQALLPWGEAQMNVRKEFGANFEDNLLKLSNEIVAIKD